MESSHFPLLGGTHHHIHPISQRHHNLRLPPFYPAGSRSRRTLMLGHTGGNPADRDNFAARLGSAQIGQIGVRRSGVERARGTSCGSLRRSRAEAAQKPRIKESSVMLVMLVMAPK